MRVVTTYDSKRGERKIAILSEEEWLPGFGLKIYWKQLHNLEEEDAKEYVGFVNPEGFVIPINFLIINYGVVKGVSTPLGKAMLKTEYLTLDEFGLPLPSTQDRKKKILRRNLNFSRQVVETGDIAFAYKTAIAPYVSKEEALAKGSKLLKKKEVKSVMKKLVEEAAERVGVDRDFVFVRLKELSQGEGNTALGAAKELSEILEMKEKQSARTNLNINATLPLTVEDMQALDDAKRHKLAEVAEYEEE